MRSGGGWQQRKGMAGDTDNAGSEDKCPQCGDNVENVNLEGGFRALAGGEEW